MTEFKANCDICGEPFSKDDIADPHGVVRLRPISEEEVGGVKGRNVVVVGFGSGYGTWFVHSRCLDVSKRVGNLHGYGDAN